MPNELPIPPELQHLIEKRTGEDRRDESPPPEPKPTGESRGTAVPERRRRDRRKG
jgi:hypothetical protein